MLTKNISIIPNYEPCPHKCWFCIWKNHSLKNVKGPSLQAIEQFLKKYSKLGYWKFSISGSDIIFEKMNKYDEWWDEIFKLANKYNMVIDIHTRSRIFNKDFLEVENIRKLVLSTVNVKDCKSYIDWLRNVFDGFIRIVKVVTSNTTCDIIEEYIKFCQDYNIELTFKQLYGYDDNGNYYKYKSIYNNCDSRVVFLDIGDYNIYLMPDGNEYYKFVF